MNNDYIFLEDISVFVKIGVTKEERKELQKVLVSVKIFVDLKKASLSDELEDTLDYQYVYDGICGLCSKKEWKLVESFAEDIAGFIKNNKKVMSTEIKISKYVLGDGCASGVVMHF